LPADAIPSLLFVEDLPGVGRRTTLSEEESHYLSRVCRARPGERVAATDGRGTLATVRLVEGGRSAVVEVERCDHCEPARHGWVLSGSPEGERGDWLVEKLAELGLSVFQPLDCERGGWEKMRGRAERWRRVAVAALRQSRRRFLLEIRDPIPLAEALAGLPAGEGRWLADPAGPAAGTLRPGVEALTVGLIGPSAGLSGPEREAALAAGFAPICFSDSRLRTETAAMAWACWWAAPGAGPDRAS
jgi:16S rRNA (uracil1498-N3)-methyltransferase